MRNFEINEMMGFWNVIQYYASSEEALEYSCMKCNFSISSENAHVGPYLYLRIFFFQTYYLNFVSNIYSDEFFQNGILKKPLFVSNFKLNFF